MSPKGSIIALSVMGTGFDVYDLDTGVCLASFADVSGGGERIVPVLFLHGGRALLGGGTAGRATLWNVHNKRIHQTLTPERESDQLYLHCVCLTMVLAYNTILAISVSTRT